MRVRETDSLAAVPAAAWNALPGVAANPFVRHEFLSALLETGCACARTGWRPRFLIAERDGALAGALPLFEKTHSYGEYVFDWAWAQAYAHAGRAYYPKLVCAVPFTPVAGPRLLATDTEARAALLAAALERARERSSLHVLFPRAAEARDLADRHGFLLRRSVQYHWRNEGYRDFDDFLSRLTHRRRKTIRQERRRVAEAGVRFRWLAGGEADAQDWLFVERCYRATYAAHRSLPYLNLAFFRRLGERLPAETRILLALRAGRPVAMALLFAAGGTLYGRHWGTVEPIPLLHFETCYYRPIAYAIEQGLERFEGGAQGEHKILRGLLPAETLSAHWIAEARFARAIATHLESERRALAHYVDELAEHSPFRTQAPCGES